MDGPTSPTDFANLSEPDNTEGLGIDKAGPATPSLHQISHGSEPYLSTWIGKRAEPVYPIRAQQDQQAPRPRRRTAEQIWWPSRCKVPWSKEWNVHVESWIHIYAQHLVIPCRAKDVIERCCGEMEKEYDKLMQLKTKCELQGFKQHHVSNQFWQNLATFLSKQTTCYIYGMNSWHMISSIVHAVWIKAGECRGQANHRFNICVLASPALW